MQVSGASHGNILEVTVVRLSGDALGTYSLAGDATVAQLQAQLAPLCSSFGGWELILGGRVLSDASELLHLGVWTGGLKQELVATVRALGTDAIVPLTVSQCQRSDMPNFQLHMQREPPPLASPTPSPKPAIGLDLGTMCSCVGIWRNEGVDILTDDSGNCNAPLCVAFTDSGPVFGVEAKMKADQDPTNVVYGMKRLVGHMFADASVQADLKLLPFRCVAGEEGKTAAAVVSVMGGDQMLGMEEISSMLVAKLKVCCEAQLGEEIVNCVITVPAYFNDLQRRLTKNTAEIVGLDVLRIMNEPTAAAMAYGLDKGIGEGIALIFDMGGCTCDVSLLLIEDGLIEVIATAGDLHLGGQDLDKHLLNLCIDDFRCKFPDKDVAEDFNAVSRLLRQCESGKKQLSMCSEASIEIGSLHDGIGFSRTVSRSCFELLIVDDLRRATNLVQVCLDRGGIAKEAVKDVVLAGGSSYIPAIQNMLQGLFDGSTLCRSINPDQVVAHGAAVQAAILSGAISTPVQDLMCIMDVTPLTLGLESAGGLMTPVIHRNTTIPTQWRLLLTTFAANQSEALIRVLEGERALAKENILLAELRLPIQTPAAQGTPRIDVIFEIAINGNLLVRVENVTTGEVNQVIVTTAQMGLSADGISRRLDLAELHKADDERVVSEIREQYGLQNLVHVVA